ncbi:MAG: cupin domain-containing protein [Pseudomonadota bacterium]
MSDDPGFGMFLKEHREFFDALTDEGWEDVPGYAGVTSKVLSGRMDHAGRQGAVTRISRWAPGAAVSDVVTHDWCEEVFLISGAMSIGTPEQEQQALPVGTYAVRPPGIPHGPFFSRNGCLLIEFNYYPLKGSGNVEA